MVLGQLSEPECINPPVEATPRYVSPPTQARGKRSRAYRFPWSSSACDNFSCTSGVDTIYRAYFSICEIVHQELKGGAAMKRGYTYFVQPRADIRAHDKLDALDLSLHEHDPRVFCLGRVGIPTERLDGIRLEKDEECKIVPSLLPTQGENKKSAHLPADVVEEGTENLCLHGEYVRRMPFVEPMPHELLEECLARGAKV